MTDEQLRAHGLLNGQTLLVEWTRLMEVLGARGKIWYPVHAAWCAAVHKNFGEFPFAKWDHVECVLKNGEVYRVTD